MAPLLRPLLILPLLALPALAASAPVQPAAEPIDLALRRARAEAATADAQAKRHEQAASAARDEASRLRARQAAAAEAIAGAEARISAAEVEAAIVSARLAAKRAELRQRQAPVSSLLAGLALMAERPPLLAIADSGGVEDLVRVRLLLDSTLPEIRRRTARLSTELQQGRQLQADVLLARDRLRASRDELTRRKQEFAALETKVLALAQQSGSAALSSGDVVLARSEDIERLERQAGRSASNARLAADVAALGMAPPRPFAADGPRAPATLPYRLPSDARVVDGLGSVDASGVRSRGLVLGTGRGSAVVVPAAGMVRFSGPFRQHDAIVVIDHGNGWMSLILDVASPLKRGARVEAGAPLGRALGQIGVELSHNGQPVSPALIAGSSVPLSNGGKGR